MDGRKNSRIHCNWTAEEGFRVWKAKWCKIQHRILQSHSTSTITFKMITSLKSTTMISFNLRNLINFNKIKNSITINKKKLTGFNSLPSQSSSKSDHIQEGRESLSTNPMILYEGRSVLGWTKAKLFYKMADGILQETGCCFLTLCFPYLMTARVCHVHLCPDLWRAKCLECVRTGCLCLAANFDPSC